jgi:hypothetical protein
MIVFSAPTAGTYVYPDVAQTALVSREAQRRALSFDPLSPVTIVVSFAPGDTVAAVAPPSSTRIDIGLPAVSIRSPADQTIAQLLSFEQLGPDWDGNHAAAPISSSIKGARTFLRALSPESQIPQPTLHANGNVLLFVNGPDGYAELEFLDDRRIEFFASRDDRQWSEEIQFNGRSLPEGLSAIGFAI